jgi:enamine deaminase RidA (YjgF/YER057c/UK114 family)
MTNTVEARLATRGLRLPSPWMVPEGVVTVASHVRVHGRRLFVSAHFPIDAHGRIAGPFGRVGAEVDLGQARQAACATMLSILASLKRELGDLERIGAWLRVFGLVNVAPGFVELPAVLNAASDVIEAGFGRSIGSHARFVAGAASLAWNAPVAIEAELELKEEN